jgi:hypothetical protein
MNTFVHYDDIIGYKVGLGTRFGRLFTSINFLKTIQEEHHGVIL